MTLVVVFVLGFVVFFGPKVADRVANRVLRSGPYTTSERAQALFDDLFVVDLHGDSLLWDRDLLQRLDHGAIDVPRLIEGNVGIQCFFIVSKSPFDQDIDRTRDETDAVTLLVAAQGWPLRTWGSLLERALYQSQRLHDLAMRSEGKLVVLESKRDLLRYREVRARGAPIVAGVLGVEGAHVLEGELAHLDDLFAAGVRIVAPTHFFDNRIGGSAHGVDKGGLTELGRRMISEMETRGMLLDLAHASKATIEDALAITRKPVVVSHTGVRGTCDNNRNLADAELRAIAATGGVIGIGYWDTAVCGEDAAAIARAVRYTADLVGVEHVALGSDFDGAVPVPFDTTGLALVVEALLDAGFGEPDIRRIMGENAARVLEGTLPD